MQITSHSNKHLLPGYSSNPSSRLVQINNDSLKQKLKAALGEKPNGKTHIANTLEQEKVFFAILNDGQTNKNRGQLQKAPGEYQVNFQIYSSSNTNIHSGIGSYPDRPGTAMSVKKISATSKNTTAPHSFFSNTSANNLGCQAAVATANCFPGCLNYTNITDYV